MSFLNVKITKIEFLSVIKQIRYFYRLRKMRNTLFTIILLAVLSMINSCGNSAADKSKINGKTGEKITQQADGTISLNIEKASCYNDDVNPSCNTAEWNFIVSKPGRYNVWLSSATIDTMNLQYASSVKISLLDERLDVRPVGDKIVLDANDVKYPYFRADSYMGSFYIQEAGEYSIQVISEKVLPKKNIASAPSSSNHTRLMSVILTPMTR